MVTNMKNRALKWQIIFLVVIIFVIAVAYLPVKSVFSPVVDISRNIFGISATSTITLTAPSGDIQVEVANTPTLQSRGLSGRTSMSADHGMLFVFTHPSIYGFWMKDMNYPLDMVWVDAEHRVVSINTDIATSTYPNAIFPVSNVLYVLELSAGASRHFGIATGTVLKFEAQ